MTDAADGLQSSLRPCHNGIRKSTSVSYSPTTKIFLRELNSSLAQAGKEKEVI